MDCSIVDTRMFQSFWLAVYPVKSRQECVIDDSSVASRAILRWQMDHGMTRPASGKSHRFGQFQCRRD